MNNLSAQMTRIPRNNRASYRSPRSEGEDVVLPLLLAMGSRAFAFGPALQVILARKGSPIVNDAVRSVSQHAKERYGFKARDVREISINDLPEYVRGSPEMREISRALEEGNKLFMAKDTSRYAIVVAKRGRPVYSACFE
jgi:hypothetical protein